MSFEEPVLVPDEEFALVPDALPDEVIPVRLYGMLPDIPLSTGGTVQGFPVEIKRPHKIAVLRLPTPAELIDYLSAQKSIARDLGRRQTETESVPNPKASLKLFKSIRLDKVSSVDQEFDADEAEYAIGKIMKSKVSGCAHIGDQYVITISTPFADTCHTLDIPFRRDLAQFQRTMYKPRDMGNGMEERRFPPVASVTLYDKVFAHATGYFVEAEQDARKVIPPHHKSAAVWELVAAMDQEDSDISPN